MSDILQKKSSPVTRIKYKYPAANCAKNTIVRSIYPSWYNTF